MKRKKHQLEKHRIFSQDRQILPSNNARRIDMRKLIASATALICLFLCACGTMYADTDPRTDTTMPMESMMPDIEDGVVKDQDGVIEDREKDAQQSAAPERTANP